MVCMEDGGTVAPERSFGKISFVVVIPGPCEVTLCTIGVFISLTVSCGGEILKVRLFRESSYLFLYGVEIKLVIIVLVPHHPFYEMPAELVFPCQ